MVENQYDNLRQEVKFLIPLHAMVELRNLLVIEGWESLYPTREVHSIYFDTASDNLLFDSIHGIFKRTKYRARWYNQDKKFVIEIKMKSAGVGTKSISSSFSFNSDVPRDNELNDALREFANICLIKSSYVSYLREYYVHGLTGARMTLDCSIKTLDYLSFIERQINDFFILEVKSGIAANLAVSFGQFQSRFSKYCFSRVGDDSFY